MWCPEIWRSQRALVLVFPVLPFGVQRCAVSSHIVMHIVEILLDPLSLFEQSMQIGVGRSIPMRCRYLGGVEIRHILSGSKGLACRWNRGCAQHVQPWQRLQPRPSDVFDVRFCSSRAWGTRPLAVYYCHRLHPGQTFCPTFLSRTLCRSWIRANQNAGWGKGHVSLRHIPHRRRTSLGSEGEA
jgi:hypothetical protein